MTKSDLSKLRDYAVLLGFTVFMFDHWGKNEFIVTMPQVKEYCSDCFILDCTYHNMNNLDIIKKDSILPFLGTGINVGSNTYKTEYLNLETMKRWLRLMLSINKKFEMEKLKNRLEKDF